MENKTDGPVTVAATLHVRDDDEPDPDPDTADDITTAADRFIESPTNTNNRKDHD